MGLRCGARHPHRIFRSVRYARLLSCLSKGGPIMVFTPIAKSLIVAGAWLFVFGLLEGAAVPMFANPRMGLSAHLTAVQSGMALMILGLAWPIVRWSKVQETLSFFAIVIGTYGLWIGLTLAAATGASEALPMAGHGYGASRLIEQIVSAVVIASGGLMTIGWLIFSVALVRPKAD
jgi:(hydroxyamino)benzene mutase